ncbi:MAG: SDR family oxidoreductase [Chloroflexota bacterium]|nr:SDR family oxidoreductase [Chloroflexota bacterium]
MNILIIGGTRFLGRYLTEAALQAGHQVTLFNRGKTNANLFPKVEQLHGDRQTAEGHDVLRGRRWDVAIDTCGYVPRHVRLTAERLADAVERYVFISTISVYSDALQPESDESGPLATLDDPTTDVVDGATYGGLKVLCEQAAETALPGRVLQVRSGLIVGPHDPTDRFTYWVARVAAGGEVLAPDSPSTRVQFIDVRDEAEWIINMAAARATGIYNVTGPTAPLTMGEVLETCRAVSGSDAQLVWVSAEFLQAHDIQPFRDMPLWVPEGHDAVLRLRVNKAVADGLTFRPLATTIADTLAWHRTRPAAEQAALQAGITAEREAELLREWKEA